MIASNMFTFTWRKMEGHPSGPMTDALLNDSNQEPNRYSLDTLKEISLESPNFPHRKISISCQTWGTGEMRACKAVRLDQGSEQLKDWRGCVDHRWWVMGNLDEFGVPLTCLVVVCCCLTVFPLQDMICSHLRSNGWSGHTAWIEHVPSWLETILIVM